MINRTIHFPSLIIWISKAFRGVSLTQVVANILQVQVQTPEKSKQSHHLSTKTLHSLWFDWATSCITSYLSPYPSVSQNREWMWSIWSICASDLSAISAWRPEKSWYVFIARVAMCMSQLSRFEQIWICVPLLIWCARRSTNNKRFKANILKVSLNWGQWVMSQF